METRYVQEVYPLKNLTPLPCVPAFVLGVVNVRGRILPVFDLKRLLALPGTGLIDLHRIIFVRSEAIEIGILADLVIGTRSISENSLQSSLPTLTGIHSAYLKGVTSDHLVVLDLERVLADPRLIVHDEVES